MANAFDNSRQINDNKLRGAYGEQYCRFRDGQNLSDKKAHATAIALILPLCAVSALVYALNGAGEYMGDLPAAAGVFVGGIAGALLLKKASPDLLRELFYGVMMFAGIKMIFGQ